MIITLSRFELKIVLSITKIQRLFIEKNLQATIAPASCMRACLKMAARSPRGRRPSRAEAESVTIAFECVRDGRTMVARRGDLPFLATVTAVTVATEGGRTL